MKDVYLRLIRSVSVSGIRTKITQFNNFMTCVFSRSVYFIRHGVSNRI